MSTGLWQRFWDRAPRQLRFTRAGRVLVGIALAAGLAAMNTGNNLLFFGWGMVLSAIVVSGVLSEASLRILSGQVAFPQQIRVAEPAVLPLTLCNHSRHMPAYAVEIVAEVHTPAGPVAAAAPYQLRVAPGSRNALFAHFVPSRRGRCQVQQLVARTAYPFGFFEKGRRLPLASPMQFWCLPQAVPVDQLVRSVVARFGEAPLARAGAGEDFFALRPYRVGDDVRRVAWRRSAKAGRWVVIESEAVAGRELFLQLELQPGADRAAQEHAISSLGSLAEALLRRGYWVGILAPGLALVPAGGERQRWELLVGLARLEARDALPAVPLTGRRVARVALVGPGTLAPRDSAVQTVALQTPPAAREAA